MSEQKSGLIVTNPFRLAFPSVFKAQNFQGKEKFGITMLFPKDKEGTQNLVTLVKETIVAKWGADKAKWPKKLDLPLRDGDEHPEWNGFPGNIFVRAGSQFAPGIVKLVPTRDDSGAIIKGKYANVEVTDEKEIYGGCWCRAQVNAYAWEYMGKYGVSIGLQSLQKIKDGEAFGGRGDPTAAFGAHTDDGGLGFDTDDDPTGGIFAD